MKGDETLCVSIPAQGSPIMQFGGDIERILAWVYPNRVLAGATTLIVVLAIAAFGYSRGWHRTARRHPRATAASVLLALAVGAPVAWILASPLFIRTELVEAAPDGVDAVPPSPSASIVPQDSRSPAAPKATLSARSSPSPFAPTTLARGRFRGADDFHYGSGIARILESRPGEFILRFEDFSVRNGPDLFVYLSPSADGYANGAIELGRLKATDGSFNYAIPSGTDVHQLRSAVIWCKAFSVQFAHAELDD
jgi:hypothetical protein